MLSLRDANRLLAQHDVSSRTSCFVDPNATCPVCGKGVFFYANAAGGRVFFDELGPPWPKHPCTDTGSVSMTSAKNYIRPKTTGLQIELLEAWSISSQKTNGVYSKNNWRLAIALSVNRTGFENAVSFQFIGGRETLASDFLFRSPEPIIQPNDVLVIDNSELSIIHPRTLKSKRYKIEYLPSKPPAITEKS